MKLFSIRLSIFTLVFAVLVSLSGFAQDAAQVLRMSVGYRTMKNQVPMSEETRKAV